MTVRAWKIALLFAVVFLIGLLAMFPAPLAARWFMPTVPGLALGPVSGTLWEGQIASLEYRELGFGRASWSIDPLALLTLSLAADVTLDQAGGAPLNASVSVSPAGRMNVKNLHGTLGLADLARAGLLPRNIARGDLMLDLERLGVVDGAIVAADGRAGLAGLQSTLLPGVALGSYEGQLETANDIVVATFSDVEAPLRLSGRAELKPDGSYTVSGSITPTAETPEKLQQGLRFLGQPDSSGRYNFSFQGRL